MPAALNVSAGSAQAALSYKDSQCTRLGLLLLACVQPLLTIATAFPICIQVQQGVHLKTNYQAACVAMSVRVVLQRTGCWPTRGHAVSTQLLNQQLQLGSP